jgi:hypothetical protein
LEISAHLLGCCEQLQGLTGGELLLQHRRQLQRVGRSELVGLG